MPSVDDGYGNSWTQPTKQVANTPIKTGDGDGAARRAAAAEEAAVLAQLQQIEAIIAPQQQPTGLFTGNDYNPAPVGAVWGGDVYADPSKYLQSSVEQTPTSDAVGMGGAGAYYPTGEAQTLGMPDTVLGMLGAAVNPLGAIGKEAGSVFMNQNSYGMNEEVSRNYQAALQDPANAGMSTEDLVHKAKVKYWSDNPETSGYKDMNDTQLATLNAQRTADGLEPLSNQVEGGATIPKGNGDAGTFVPVTFRAGSDATDSATDMGLDLDALGIDTSGEEAATDPEAITAQSLFDERSALLQPEFQRQNARMGEGMFGSGRLGLRLSGEGIGAGKDTGMMSPDAFGLNAAQANALAGLSAQSTTDAFDQNLRAKALRQNYELALTGQGMQREQLDYNLANTDNGMLTGLTSLGSSFLGTNAGSSWLSGIGSSIGSGIYDWWKGY